MKNQYIMDALCLNGKVSQKHAEEIDEIIDLCIQNAIKKDRARAALDKYQACEKEMIAGDERTLKAEQAWHQHCITEKESMKQKILAYLEGFESNEDGDYELDMDTFKDFIKTL